MKRKIPLILLPVVGVATLVGASACLLKIIMDQVNEISESYKEEINDNDFADYDIEFKYPNKYESKEPNNNYLNDKYGDSQNSCLGDNDIDNIKEEGTLKYSTSSNEMPNFEDAVYNLPPTEREKIRALISLVKEENFEFSEDQTRYVGQIIDRLRLGGQMRVAVLLAMEFDGKNALEAFTDKQFQAIKEIIR